MNNLLQNTELAMEDNLPLYTLREKGRKSFSLPAAKDENWKYTKLRALERDDFVIERHRCNHEHCHDEDELPFEASVIKMCNGSLCHLPHNLPKGVIICSLLDAFENYEAKKLINRHIDIENNPFCALNTAYLENGVYIEIGENVEVEKPISIVHKTETGGKNLLMNLHNLVVLKQGAKAKLVEYYIYKGAQKSEYLLNVVNEINLGKNSILEHCKVQTDAFYAENITYNAVNVKENAKYNGFCLQKGANIGRNETYAELVEEGAGFVQNGAYSTYGWALLDTTTNIRHLCEKTTSSQLVKGVVGGHARGVFQGKIHIAPNADETSGTQLHKALLLSDTAEVDCKPELEIYADDVKCSHGAACGELDKEALFYMQSRGIGEEEAKQLLIEAYLRDTYANISDDSLRGWIANEL